MNGRLAKKAEEGRAFAVSDLWERLARAAAVATGRPSAFLLAVFVVIVWAATGPVFHYSDTWQLVINTGTTIVTFLMVFLIQRAQNRDTMAVQAKLAELVIAVKGAKNQVAIAEELSEHELQELHEAQLVEAEAATVGSERKKKRQRKAAAH
jgi:low affinity Fe/Cu permease